MGVQTIEVQPKDSGLKEQRGNPDRRCERTIGFGVHPCLAYNSYLIMESVILLTKDTIQAVPYSQTMHGPLKRDII